MCQKNIHVGFLTARGRSVAGSSLHLLAPAENAGDDGNMSEQNSFLKAVRGLRPEKTPVWFMRQAGRSLPEYRRLRADNDMLTACTTPDLAAEITLQPVRRYGVDAAIFFSDIVTPLYLAGLEVEIVPGKGPVFAAPVLEPKDVDRLTNHQGFDPDCITQAVQIACAELGETPLIAFAAAPFTLASYLIGKTRSKNHLEARAFMHSYPDAWNRLARWCADMSAAFLAAQIAGGARTAQVFDSWVGDLSRADYQTYCSEHSRVVIDSAHAHGVPVIHFGVGAASLLDIMRDVGAECIGVDWRLPLGEAVKLIEHGPGDRFAVQGNIDPAILFASSKVRRDHVDQVLTEGKKAAAHIVNLGHGVPPNADPAVLQEIVDQVHESH
ncbi:uroporphyrinogen decarboxylase [uncultured Varibaculum sp.]|uniref:uroporphyrinogen decarboxylase n=1 Tax=uncultured Varibaculum sp. TaxID=413896 RepID=UPI002586B03A|nr:uroporphyrinogen decarboxylase [uncultured Varibaculum sp.]